MQVLADVFDVIVQPWAWAGRVPSHSMKPAAVLEESDLKLNALDIDQAGLVMSLGMAVVESAVPQYLLLSYMT
jgi:hypothetical protein